jgi:hypothetical protein
MTVSLLLGLPWITEHRRVEINYEEYYITGVTNTGCLYNMTRMGGYVLKNERATEHKKQSKECVMQETN